MSNYFASSSDRYYQHTDYSTSHKLKSAYWTTKQAFIQKLGRKEDEHVVASDSELDAKIELFRSVQKTCYDLIRVIDRFQEKICALSQAENEMGRFLKSHGSQNKTQAGKMMNAVGKSLSFTAQQRLALTVPLTRLQSEVETFRQRAVSDTLQTIQRMEASRTEYRGALLWMKNNSEELDPDTYKQLDKFRKVQAQVKKSKVIFDKYKLDSMQKIDLLAASRCNMFSHVLAIYQETLTVFCEKAANTMQAVAEGFKGYQYYEFSMLKCLTSESKKWANLTSQNQEAFDESNPKSKEELLISGLSEEDKEQYQKQSQRLDDLNKQLEEIFSADYEDATGANIAAAMADLHKDSTENYSQFTGNFLNESDQSNKKDLDNFSFDEESFSKDWTSVFDQIPSGTFETLMQTPVNNPDSKDSILDSDLFSAEQNFKIDWFGDLHSNQVEKPIDQSTSMNEQIPKLFQSDSNETQKDANTKKTMSNAQVNKWLNLFADLDPLANPDQISKDQGHIYDT